MKIQTFIKDYNKNWRLHKLNLLSPLEYRRKRSVDSSAKENEDRNLMGNTELKWLFVFNLCGSKPLKNDIKTLNTKNGVQHNCNTPSYYPMV